MLGIEPMMYFMLGKNLHTVVSYIQCSKSDMGGVAVADTGKLALAV